MSGDERCHDCPAVQYRRETDAKLENIGVQYHQLNTEIRLLAQAQRTTVERMEEWHQTHNEQMVAFDERLTAHMDEESEEMALVMAPVIVRLDEMNKTIENHGRYAEKHIAALYNRWWIVAGAVILTLLGISGWLYVETQEQFKAMVEIVDKTGD